MRPACSKTHHRGVTMLEVLVVVGVIMFLVSALFLGLSKLRERTRRDKTITLLEKVSSALEAYKLHFRTYPPSDGTLKGNEALLYFTTTAFRVNPDTSKGEVAAGVDAGPLATYANEEIQGGKIIDAWAMPLAYERSLAEDFGKAAKSTIVNFYDPSHNTAAGAGTTVRAYVYKLYSFGVNRSDDSGVGDDLTARR
jgi:type II secretory pathway pseudopilin PulG